MKARYSPTRNPHAIHGPTHEHCGDVAGDGAELRGLYGTSLRARSLAQNSDTEYVCSSLHVQDHRTTLTVNDGRRVLRPCVSREADHTTSKETMVFAFGRSSKEPKSEAQNRVLVAATISAKNVDNGSQSSVLGQHQLPPRKCGEAHKRDTCTDMDQRRPISRRLSQEPAARGSHISFMPLNLAVTCGNGNGDVKPDHPSGPGTYGHVV